MTGIEIAVLIVGVVFVLGSFFVGEKLSSKDVDQIAALSKEQLNRIVEKELLHAGDLIQNKVDDTIENSVLKIERMMDKEANQKMMSISEYSDTVLDEINKTHTEIMFLYSMLNDKHTELSDMANHLSKLILEAEKATDSKNDVIEGQSELVFQQNEPDDQNPIREVEYKNEIVVEEERNQNQKILTFAQEGFTALEIAKKLNVGIGEVRFVLDLYKGEQKG